VTSDIKIWIRTRSWRSEGSNLESQQWHQT